MSVLELTQGYNKQVVNLLEECLEAAKKGKITEIVVVYKMGLEYTHDWSGCDNLIELIGWLETIKYKQIERAQK